MARRLGPWFAIVVALVAADAIAGFAADGIPIDGRVLTAAGKPLGGARVSLVPIVSAYERGRIQLSGHPRPEPVAETSSAADGRFRLIAPEIGMWRVRLSTDGFLAGEADLRPLLYTQQLETFRAQPAERVQVRVEDSEGQPVANAWVLAFPTGYRGSGGGRWRLARQRVLTNELGIAWVLRKSGENAGLKAFAPGHLASDPLETRDSEARLVLPEGFPRTLEVRDSRRTPLPEALVRLAGYRLPIGVTDEQGRISIATAADRETTIQVLLESGLTGEGRWTELPADIDEPLVVTVPDGMETTGRVLDADSREPLAGAVVWSRSDPSSFTLSANDGSFSLFAPESDRFWLTAAAPRYLEAGVRGDRDSPLALVLALTPSAAIRGDVVNASGEPIEGAEVQATLMSAPGRRWYGSPTPARTDADGAFELRRLDPSTTYWIRATSEEYAPTGERVGNLEPRRTRSGLRLVLRTGLAATGRVVSSERAPVPAARVRLIPAPSSSTPGHYMAPFRDDEEDANEATTDAEGRFELLHLTGGAKRSNEEEY